MTADLSLSPVLPSLRYLYQSKLRGWDGGPSGLGAGGRGPPRAARPGTRLLVRVRRPARVPRPPLARQSNFAAAL